MKVTIVFYSYLSAKRSKDYMLFDDIEMGEYFENVYFRCTL